MKHIFLNLKRFDVPPEYGGVNRLAPIGLWGNEIISSTQKLLKDLPTENVEIVQFFPEAHLLSAMAAREENSPIKLGCQGVYRTNTAPGGNFGALTTNRPASAMRAMGVESALIGHCEERADLSGVLAEAAAQDYAAVNRILNREIKAAQESGLSVLYCIGERGEEQDDWEAILGAQLELGLADVDLGRVTIAYEPIWSIGPGKVPADKPYITKVARFIKQVTGGVDVVYGGGLKTDNARMLASIEEIDGGLIALTRFSGEIGFYPEEYAQIIRLYLE